MTFRPPVDLLPIDFKELSDEVLSAAEIHDSVHRTKAGVLAIDFKNPKALRELTAAVLWIKFQLRLEVPLDTLLPPIPNSSDNRLGYVAWTEHLTRRIAGSERCSLDGFIHGIDIGTGASCIYPLLACRRNTLLRFLALDIDTRQIDYAKENVKLNSFTDVISVVLNEEKNHILPKMLLGDTKYAFCMCNPPFYRNTAEIHASKSMKRQIPSAICTGSRTEMITEGGELGFLKKLLKESLLLQDAVLWFTSLVGKRENYELFLKELMDTKTNMIPNLEVETAEFFNGKTIRWGVAWRVPVVSEQSPMRHRNKKPK